MPRSYKFLLAAALVLAAGSVTVSAVLFSVVAQSRVNVAYQACAEQNARHDKTLTQLDRLIAAIPDPARRKRAQDNTGGTVALIEALAPRQDCLRLVRRRFGADVRPET